MKGTLFTVQKSLPHLNDGSSIIRNASIASVKGIPGLSVYNAAKAALRSFARVWMMDLREHRIRVNVISPGPIDTPLNSKLGLPPAEMRARAAAIVSTVPAGRFGRPEEVAAAAAYLAADESAFVVGAELIIDGGLSIL